MKPEPADLESGITAKEGWLTPFAQDQEALRLAEMERRLQADADLVYRLQFAGYDGPDWDQVADRLASYGLRILTAWTLDGTIRTKCLEKQWPGPWDERCRDSGVASDLAVMTVSEALVKFRDNVLVPGKWKPNRGASLSTYFIGQCLLRWANVYNAWFEQQKNHLPVARYTQERLREDTAHQVLDQMEFDELLADDPLLCTIIQLREAGFSWDEIHVITGESPSAARGRLYRFRKSLQSAPTTQEAS